MANLIKMSAREKPLMPRRPLVSGHVEIFLHHHSLATLIHFLPFYLKEKRSSALRLQRRDNDSNTLRSLPNAFSWFWTKIRGGREKKNTSVLCSGSGCFADNQKLTSSSQPQTINKSHAGCTLVRANRISPVSPALWTLWLFLSFCPK